MRTRAKLDQRYLRWAIADPQFISHVKAVQTGTAVPHISGKQIENYELVCPPLEEQRRIAWVLGSLDDKIELNRRIAETLEQIAAAIFRARFVDFVGVEEFDESEIGPIPKGWKLAPFSEIVEINPKVSLKKGEPAPYIEMAAVPAWGTRPTSVGHRPYNGGSRFERGDTLMARITGCIENGKGAFIDFLDGPAAGSTEFLVLRASGALTPEAVFFLSRTPRVREKAIANMSGSSGRQRVPTSCFDSLLIPVPPSRDVWRDEANLLARALRKGRALWEESKTLTSLRDALLPKLISGEIRVPEGFGPDADPSELVGDDTPAPTTASGEDRTTSSSTAAA